MSGSYQTLFPAETKNLLRLSSLIYDRHLTGAAGGNVSARCDDGMLITATDVSLRQVAPEDLVYCDLDGAVRECVPPRRPSKELRLHAAAYRLRREVNYVIHAHPLFSIIWTLEGNPLPLLTVSSQRKLREVPTISGAVPGSRELEKKAADAIAGTAPDICAFLMEGHGVLVLGATMEECFARAELLEEAAAVAVFHKCLHKTSL